MRANEPFASNSTLEEFVATMAEGLLVHDAAGALIFRNATAERVLGEPAPVSPAAHVDAPSRPEHVALAVLATGEARQHVLVPFSRRLDEPAGATWLSISSVPMREANGRPAGVVTTFSDVTRLLLASDAGLRTVLAETQALVTLLESKLRSLDARPELLAICMYCKRVRDEHDDWAVLERYLTTHLGIRLSHGLCPGCSATHFPSTDG